MKLLLLTTLILNTSLVIAGINKLQALQFLVTTNVPGVNFQGQLKEAQSIQIQNNEKTQELTIPIAALETGIDLRDKHMREKIFQNKDIKLVGNLSCVDNCYLEGKITIAETTKEMKIPVVKKNDQYFFETQIALDQFNIKAPEFMNVKVKNEISISGDFL